MNTPVLPAYVEECKLLDTLDFAAEIPPLWRRYRQLHATRARTKTELATERLELGRRLQRVHDFVADIREFSRWLRFHDINRSTAYRAMDEAAGRVRPKKRAVHCPTWNALTAGAFLLAPGELVLALPPGQAAVLRRAVARQVSAGISKTVLIDRICHALARRAALAAPAKERLH